MKDVLTAVMAKGPTLNPGGEGVVDDGMLEDVLARLEGQFDLVPFNQVILEWEVRAFKCLHFRYTRGVTLISLSVTLYHFTLHTLLTLSYLPYLASTGEPLHITLHSMPISLYLFSNFTICCVYILLLQRKGRST